MAEEQGGTLKPISPARVAQELRKLSSERAAGGVKPDEYEHRKERPGSREEVGARRDGIVKIHAVDSFLQSPRMKTIFFDFGKRFGKDFRLIISGIRNLESGICNRIR